MFLAFWFGFLLGVLAILGLEAWILLAVIGRLRRRSVESKPPDDQTVRDLDAEQSLASTLNKQLIIVEDQAASKTKGRCESPEKSLRQLSSWKGIVWVLESEKIPKFDTDESPTKSSKEPRNKKNILKVCPIKKYAKIKDRSLILSDLDGSQRTIELLDCTIVAVSASSLSSRKWAKRYPIRLQSKNSVLYNGSKTCYIYFETSWEKELWCKALRIASCPDNAKLNWFAQLSGEFHNYLMSLTAEYPSFLKPPALLCEAPDKTNRIDVSSSKVRGFLKKIAKKASKNGVESKSASVSSSTRGERRLGDKTHFLHDVSSIDESVKSSLEIGSNNSLQDLVQPSSPASSRSLLQITPDSVCSQKILYDDEGTICWNLLFSRLFFDAKRSIGLNDAIKSRIQRTLSHMKTPGFIAGVKCTGLDLGDLPPLIHKMRVIPLDLNEVWAMEVDIEYSGGIVLDVETRIEVYEQELQKDGLDNSLGLRSSGEETSHLLDGTDLSSNSADQMENRDDGNREDGLKQSKSTKWASNYASRWKAAVHSIANKVAQVPLSLAIRIASLRGTLRLHIKPPPSDQIWFGFTSAPEIEWNLDSSVGDQKITSRHLALLIGNRFKASIRETLVLPNCESICIPWMLAEKDDWVPRHVAPFKWINQEASDTTELDGSSTGSKTNAVTGADNKGEKIQNIVDIQHLPEKSETKTTGSQNGSIRSVSSDQHPETSKSEELREPLLRTDENQEGHGQSTDESPKKTSSSSSCENLTLLDQPAIRSIPSEEEAKPKRVGKRARMMGLGKRMQEKLEEKKRLIEERGRHVVEKMRENTRT